MALVILSAGTMTRSRMLTLSTRAVAGIGVSLALLVLAGGFALGYGFSQDGAREQVIDTAQTESRVLIDRFGELAVRMMQLEVEAQELATRLGAMGDIQARGADKLPAGGRIARTPPGSSGGPMLMPTAASGVEHEEELPAGLSRLEHDIERLAGSLAAIDEAATSHSIRFMSLPGRAPVVGADVTSGFGVRRDPFRGSAAFHSGVDYPAPRGAPILASAGGRVIFAGYRSEYGHTVEIDHGDGLVTRYAHASRLYVKRGEVVTPGQKIAAVGSSGRSTGPHLHFEILKDGRFVNPAIYLARH